MRQLRAYGGAPLPLPLQRAATALWRDEAHVDGEPRALPREVRAGRPVLGDMPGYSPPQAGFFLWLQVGDGEAAALRLWRETGVRVLPGGYLGRADRRTAATRGRTTSASRWWPTPPRSRAASPRSAPRSGRRLQEKVG